MESSVVIREFRLDDYDEAIELWKQVEGVEIAEGDSKDDIAKYLSRNPGLSRAAFLNDKLIGVALCGHDGRRGLIYHVAVDPARQQKGIGRRLVDDCVAGLRSVGLKRVLILVAGDNDAAHAFWRRCGWEDVPGADLMGRDL